MLEFIRNKTYLSEEVNLIPESIDDISSKVNDLVTGFGLDEEMQIKLRLALETVLVNWMDAYAGQVVDLKLYRLWGRHHIVMSLAGEKHNPLLDSNLYGLPLEYESIINDIRSETDICPDYRYSDGNNVVSLALPRKEISSLGKIVIAIVAAFITYGVFLGLPTEFGDYVTKEVFTPVTSVLLNIIKMLSSIMVFTAMVTSICNIGDMRTFSKYGRALLLHIQCRNFTAVFLGLGMALFFTNLQISGYSFDARTLSPLIEIVLGVFPSNIVKPFAENNSLQILFMGFAVGCFFLTVQERVRILFNGLKELHFTVMELLAITCKCIPYIVYLSVVGLLWSGSLGKIALVLDYGIVFVSALLLYLVGTLSYAAWRADVSLAGLVRELLAPVITGISSASSMAVMPLVDKVCRERYRIEENLLNFGLPFSIIMHKPLAGMYMMVVTVVTLQSYNVDVSLPQLISAGILVGFMTSAIPPVPGGLFVVMTIAFNHFQLPQEALALPLAVDFIFDMLRTGFQGYNWGVELILMNKKLSENHE